MKILKIFGLVVGIHVVAFMFVFAIPGCRSTSRHSPPPPESVQASEAAVRAAPPTSVNEGANPVSAGETSPASDNALNPVSASPNSGNGATALNLTTDANGTPVVRFNPTRPGSTAALTVQEPSGMGSTTTTPASTYLVVSGDNLWKIAKKHGISTKELAAANHLHTDAPLREGQKILIPGKTIPSSSASVVPAGNPAETLTYRVKSGDTLAVIARRAGTTSAAIKSLNHLKSDNLHAGQELTLPANGNTASTLAAAPEENTGGKGKNASGLHHIVKSGETLGLIAKHYGVSRRDLAVANNIADPLKLRAGQDLVIPGKSASTAKSSTAPSSETTAPTNSAAPAPAPANDSPIAPAASDASPVAAPPAAEPTPPVIQVQDSNNPVSSAK